MSFVWNVCLFIIRCILDLIIFPRVIYLAILQIIRTLLAELGDKVNQFKFLFNGQGRRVKDEVDSVPQKDGDLLVYILDFVKSFSAVWSKKTRFYLIVTGNDRNSHEDILKCLGISHRDIVPSMDECNVILAFIPIVSRAGTDIEAALMKIPEIHPAVIVVLHHTFDPDYVAPDSRRAINRGNILAVDCLFHEDKGLLECSRNSKALKETEKYLQDIKAPVGQSLLSRIVQWCWSTVQKSPGSKPTTATLSLLGP